MQMVQHCWPTIATLLGPTCCVRLHVTTMLALVAYEFETGQTFRPMQTDATLLATNPQQHATMLWLVASVFIQMNFQILMFSSADNKLTQWLGVWLVKYWSKFKTVLNPKFFPKLRKIFKVIFNMIFPSITGTSENSNLFISTEGSSYRESTVGKKTRLWKVVTTYRTAGFSLRTSQ